MPGKVSSSRIESLEILRQSITTMDAATLIDTVHATAMHSDEALKILREPTPEGGIPMAINNDPGGLEGVAYVIESWTVSKMCDELIADCCERLIDVAAEDASTRDSFNKGAQALLQTLSSTRHDGACERAAASLEKICRLALRDQTKHTLTGLPAEWLNQLISLAGSTAEYTTCLRRSAGLPIGVRAILRADEQTNTPTLLQPCFHALLLLGRGTAPIECRRSGADNYVASDDASRVHGLNILRLLCLDKAIRMHTSPRLTACFALTLDLLRSPSWAVRNSSALCFSAVLERTLRSHAKPCPRLQGMELFTGTFRNNDDEIECQPRFGKLDPRRVTHRMPELIPLIEKTLGMAVNEHMQHATANVANGANVGHSSESLTLFCSLLFVVQLSAPPPTAQMAACSMLDLSSMRSLVDSCAGSPSYHIRALAARAFVPLVPHTQLLSTCISICAELPASPHAPISHNRVHGLLLQVRSLLLAAARSTRLTHPEAREKWALVAAEVELGQAVESALRPASWLRACKCGVICHEMRQTMLLAGFLRRQAQESCSSTCSITRSCY